MRTSNMQMAVFAAVQLALGQTTPHFTTANQARNKLNGGRPMFKYNRRRQMSKSKRK